VRGERKKHYRIERERERDVIAEIVSQAKIKS
jgi:hypothetical protein